jgi:hypothetical protein
MLSLSADQADAVCLQFVNLVCAQLTNLRL